MRAIYKLLLIPDFYWIVVIAVLAVTTYLAYHFLELIAAEFGSKAQEALKSTTLSDIK